MIEASRRVAMVSGASRGIGRAVAQGLLAKGYSVSAGARDPAAAEAALGGPQDRLLCGRYDAVDRSSHADWLKATLKRFGRLDALVNNAGTSNRFSIEEGDEEELDALWAVNVKGPLFLTRICLPHLRASGSGRVVNIVSLSGKRVKNENIAYAMTKHAMMAFNQGLRRIGWDDGLRATAVCPSFVATDLTAGVTKTPKEEMIDAADLAELVATAIALPNNAVMAEMLVNCRLEDTL